MKKSRAIISLVTALVMIAMCFSVPTMAEVNSKTNDAIMEAVNAIAAEKKTDPKLRELFRDDFSDGLDAVNYVMDGNEGNYEISVTNGKFTFKHNTTATSYDGFRYLGKKDGKLLSSVIKNLAVIQYELTVPDTATTNKEYPYVYIQGSSGEQITTYLNTQSGMFSIERPYLGNYREDTAESFGTHKYTYVIDYAERKYYLIVDNVKYGPYNFKGEASSTVPSEFLKIHLYNSSSSDFEYKLDNVVVYEIVDGDAVETIEEYAQMLGKINNMKSPVMYEVFHDDFSGDISDVDYIVKNSDYQNTVSSDTITVEDGKLTLRKNSTAAYGDWFYYNGKSNESLDDVIKNLAVIEYTLIFPEDTSGTGSSYPYFDICSGDSGQIQTYIKASNGMLTNVTKKDGSNIAYDVGEGYYGTHTYTYVIDYTSGKYYAFIDGEKYEVEDTTDLITFRQSVNTPSDTFRLRLYDADACDTVYQLDNVRVYEIVDGDYRFGKANFPENYAVGINTITLEATKLQVSAKSVVAIAAVYDGNELIGISHTNALADDKFTINVNLTKDPINPIAKVFVWDSLDNMIPQMPVISEPAFVSGVKPEVVILRFDDLTVDSIPYFQKVEKYVEEDPELNVCFGVIGETWEEKATADNFEVLKGFGESEQIELWNHGYKHIKEEPGSDTTQREFLNTTYYFQSDRIRKTQNVVKENTGITMRTFGAAHNNNDGTTLDVLKEFPELDTYMYLVDKENNLLNNTSKLNLEQALDIEDNSGRVYTFDEFLDNYNKNTYEDYCILLGHPGGWDYSNKHAFDTFEQIIAFLKAEGVKFMTPAQYHDYKSQKLVTFPTYYADGMVLQRDEPIVIEGKVKANENVTISLADQQINTSSDHDGHFEVTFNPMSANKNGCTLSVSTEDGTEQINDILIGDVWLVSGQSNAEYSMDAWYSEWYYPKEETLRVKDDVAKANYPLVRYTRLYYTNNDGYTDARTPYNALIYMPWVPVTSEYAADVGAIAFYFGRDVSKEEPDIPLGFINVAKAGKPIEQFEEGNPAFNEMVNPLENIRIKGMLFDQGENNFDDVSYGEKLTNLVGTYRTFFENPEMPFIFVQLHRYCKASSDNVYYKNYRYINNVMRNAEDRDNGIYMAVSIDLNDKDQMSQNHPIGKDKLGNRLARLALHYVYGHENIIPSGPTLKDYTPDGDEMLLSFETYGSALKCSNADDLQGFKLAGADGVFYDATAKIDGETQIVVTSPYVSEPVNVRYNYEIFPDPITLFNTEDIPASPFATDNPPFAYDYVEQTE